MAYFVGPYFVGPYFDVEEAEEPAPGPFIIKRNGEDADLDPFSNDQLSRLALVDSAFDASISIGSITVPGDPGWVAGDRLAFYDGDTFITLAYCADRGNRHQNIETLALETTYSLMDANRQLIGRKTVDWVRNEEEADGRLTAWFEEVAPDLAAKTDLVTFVANDTTMLPAKTYTGDGVTDLVADLILYTGKTVYLRAIEDDSFELHFEDLTDTQDSGISIDDTPGAAGGDVFYPVNPSREYSAADLKNVIEARNGVVTVAGTNSGSVTLHGAGGLKWEAVLNYTNTEDDLVLFVNNLLLTAGDEKPTYKAGFGPATSAKVARVPAGAGITVNSAVLLLGDTLQRTANRRLEFARDEQGKPMVGWWVASFDFAYPSREPTAVVGYGGQGGSAGALADLFNIPDHVDVTYGDLSAVPVGQETLVRAELKGSIGNAVTLPDVEITFEIEEFEEDGVTPSSDWSLSPAAVQTTDEVGRAVVFLVHDSNTSWATVRVKASI